MGIWYIGSATTQQWLGNEGLFAKRKKSKQIEDAILLGELKKREVIQTQED